ncbi:MAG: hypothetical protein VW378_04330 [bacterium]
MTQLHQDGIKEKIRHRYENLLLDKVKIAEPNHPGELQLKIEKNDLLNRHIFFRQKEHGRYCLLSALYLEVLALGAIASTKGVTKDDLIIFASAAKYTKEKDFYINTSLQGTVHSLGNKRGFHKYSGQLYDSNQQRLAQGEMVAYYIKDNDDISQEVQKQALTIPSSNCKKVANKNSDLKHPDLVITDELFFSSETEAWASYFFPETHICNKGHFPGNPLLMGVLQVTSIEDTVLLWLKERDIRGHITMKVNAKLYKSHYGMIAELKNTELKAWHDVEGIVDQCEVKSVQKVIFKQPLRPKEEIYIHITFLEVQIV